MLIELKDINNEIFCINPDQIVIAYRKPNTDIYVLRTLVEDREIDTGTMVYLHSAPTLSLSIIKIDEKELAKCKNSVSQMFPAMQPRIIIEEPASRIFYPQDTVQLRYSILDSTETTITWSSTDEAVATVSTSGLVTFKQPGTTTIMASNNNIPAPGVVMLSVNPVLLSVTPTEKTLLVDSPKFQITHIATPNEAVTWTSTAPLVATVVNGLVTPLKAGNAVIKATLRGITQNVSITIPEPIISVNVADTLELQVTKTKQITVSVENLNNKNVTWSTSASDIVSVTNGLITAIKTGTAIIKATVGTVEKAITVNVPNVVITAPATLTLTEGATTTWSVSVSGTDSKPTLSSNDTSICTINQAGLVTALIAGETTVVASIHGVSKTCTVTVEAPVTPE